MASLRSQLLEAGHFALETYASEIGALMRDFLKRRKIWGRLTLPPLLTGRGSHHGENLAQGAALADACKLTPRRVTLQTANAAVESGEARGKQVVEIEGGD